MIICGGLAMLLDRMPTIRNYETALCDILWYKPDHVDFGTIRFGGALINSIIIALISTVLTLVFGWRPMRWYGFALWGATARRWARWRCG